MLDKNTLIKITNRYDGMAGYEVADLGINRLFMAGETKEVTMEEIRKLSYSIGGITLLKDFFVLDNPEAVAEILGTVEPEYFYTEEQVKELLLTGSLEALQDCLDFAPAGTIELVKKVAVETKLNDIQKRRAIQAATGFNIDAAVMINEETEEEKVEEEKTRRVATTSTTPIAASAGRRTSAPNINYKVISTAK